jgi:adenylate cyclase
MTAQPEPLDDRSAKAPADPREEMWRRLLNDAWPERRQHRIFRHIPSSPRCKGCAAPFAGPGARIMGLLGRAPWPKNPKYCGVCFAALSANHGGAEVECSLLFADVRGSTTMAEGMRPAEFTRLMGRFYDTATDVLVTHDAIVDKFVGDEVIGIFIPGMAGASHAQKAVAAAEALLRRTGHAHPGGPWVPVGAGVHTGMAYVGAIGDGLDTNLTAMGDTVNTTARLASAAGPGEILVTTSAASAARGDGGAGSSVDGGAGWSVDGLERRSLELKGKTSMTDVFVLTVAPPG